MFAYICRRPHCVVVDKGYSSRSISVWLHSHGIRHTIPHKKNACHGGSFDSAAYRDDFPGLPVTRVPLTHPHRLGPVQQMVVTVRHSRCTCNDAGLHRISRSCPTSSPKRGMVCTTAQLWQLPPVLATAPNRLPTRATSSPLLNEFGCPVRCLDGGIELAALLCHLVHLPSQGSHIYGRHPADLRAGIAIDPGGRGVGD
jgi:hypothetical protein